MKGGWPLPSLQPVETSDVEAIRRVLDQHAKLPVSVWDLGVMDNLYQAGMTSHSSVNVMLALEDELDLEFPERLLRKPTFASISSIRLAVDEVRAESAK